MKKQITEEMKEHEQWYIDAKEHTLETLPAFLNHLLNDYEHDYGTICHALAAGAIATMKAMNKTPQGGITGFQAGAIMWEFIKNWMHFDGPMRLLTYKDMLYPLNEDTYMTISKDTHEWLIKEAKDRLSLSKEENEFISQNIRDHWEKIAAGEVPFGYKLKDEL